MAQQTGLQKPESIIIQKIEENIKTIKLEKNTSISIYQSWTFPDKYRYRISPNKGRIVCLKYKNIPICLLCYKIIKNQKNFEYRIEFIQGVKSKINKIDLKKISKLRFKEKIVDLFLFATIPIAKKTKGTIIYSDVEKIKHIFYSLKKEGYTGNLQEFLKKQKYSSLSEKRKELLDIYVESIKDFEKKREFVNSIRDRYFDKYGFLNSERKRVKKIFETINASDNKTHKQKYRPKKKTYRRPGRR